MKLKQNRVWFGAQTADTDNDWQNAKTFHGQVLLWLNKILSKQFQNSFKTVLFQFCFSFI